MSNPHALIEGTPYAGYAYSYPHKTAYRPLDEPVALGPLWADERQSALYLYIHVPFCGMRCGFCNLFTKAKPDQALISRYLDAIQRQADQVRASLPEAAFARFAIGGGTPTYLDEEGLKTLLKVAEQTMGANLQRIGGSVEVAPGTVNREKLTLLRKHGIDRISIGIESFDEAETAAVYRPQEAETVEHALALIREASFPTLNLDLIYGLPGQTVESWLRSVRKALNHSPEEMFLYPLYVRPLTGLGKSGRDWDDIRLACYREARALLIDEGYTQVSMRMFRAPHAPKESGPSYCCQEDGMVGLGCGARSYTRSLHFASEYAVGARGVAEILADFVARPSEAFAAANYGFRLGPEEQRRRYTIQSLLDHDGLDFTAYEHRFETNVLDDLPELTNLEQLKLASQRHNRLTLSEAGLERSDAIGPWLYSSDVKTKMEDYAWR